MTLRGLLLAICGALLLGSVFLVLEASDLPEAIAAARRGEPLILPEDLLLGMAAFFAVLALSGAALLRPVLGRMERRQREVASERASQFAHFQREMRTQDKARRAEVMAERRRWEEERRGSGASPRGWMGALLAAFALSILAAIFAPDIFPRWLKARGYEPCASLDTTRWLTTRHSRTEIQQSGWAMPRDCPD